MRYLLDTNILIYLLEQKDDQLSSAQKSVLNNADNSFVLSEASLYELAIKIRQERDDFKQFTMDKINQYRKQLGINLLKTAADHYSAIPTVQKVTHNNRTHGDPFDLLILAQAQTEQLPILSTDKAFPKYSNVTVIS